MGINLLPEAGKQVQATVKKEVTVYVVAAIWFGIIVLITAGFFLYKALWQRRLDEVEAQRIKLENDLQDISPLVDLYYNIAYKTLVLDYVGSKKYKPSVVKDYIDEQIGNRGQINTYYINNEGEIKIDIVTPTYSEAVHIWHSLLKNKDIIEELNLNSFNADANGKVYFVLKGRLNLEKLYKAYEEEK